MRNTVLVIAVFGGAVIWGTGMSTRAIDPKQHKTPLIVRKVDFSFDGGSLLFEVGTLNVAEGYLLITAPESPARSKGKVLWGADVQDSGKDVGIGKERVREIVARLLHQDSSEKRLHSESTSFIVAVLAGFEPSIWGAQATDAIEENRWLTAFESTPAPEVEHFEPKETR